MCQVSRTVELEDLKIRIDETKAFLKNVYKNHINYNDILKLSQELDLLIVKYTKIKN